MIAFWIIAALLIAFALALLLPPLIAQRTGAASHNVALTLVSTLPLGAVVLYLAAGTPAALHAQAAPAAKAIEGTVRLAPGLADQASPQDAVFLFARAAEGPRQPLAALRITVADLPYRFRLDDSMAMMPDMKLSDFPSVVVAARVSKSGQPMAASGDLEGASEVLAPGASGVLLEIGKRVP